MWKQFRSGFIKENPVFGLYLGMCSSLAVSSTLNNAVGMSVCVLIVLMCANALVSALRRVTPSEIRIPVYIVIIATLVTVVQMLVQAVAPQLYSSLGVFLGLVVVNCIILGRAEAFASKNNIFPSLMDGLSMGLGYSFALCTIAVIREFLATGGIRFENPFVINQVLFQFYPNVLQGFRIILFQQPLGAFLVFGCLAALFAKLKDDASRKEKKKLIEIKESK